MVRTKIPGGKLTSEQLLAELDLCDEVGNTTLRITSRQGLQLHGVVKKNLKQAIRRINEVQLSTLGACGDVNRNVMCCPAPYQKNIYRQTQALADQLAAHFAPRTRAYHEIWLTDSTNGRKAARRPAALAETATASTSSRSTASSTCRGNSRWRSATRSTTASICMPTTWA